MSPNEDCCRQPPSLLLHLAGILVDRNFHIYKITLIHRASMKYRENRGRSEV